VIDIGTESARTLAMYGAQPGQPSFANNCLLARRLVERGVRYITLYHTDWDHHGLGGENLNDGLDGRCARSTAVRGAHRDLKQRGLWIRRWCTGRRVRPHADGRDPRHGGGAITTSTPSRCGSLAAASSRD